MRKENYFKELEYLKNLRVQIENSLKVAPPGGMRAEMSKGKYPQFYTINVDAHGSIKRGKYIRKSQLDLAKAYSQKEYDSMMLDAIKHRENELMHMLKCEDGNGLGSIFQKLSPAKQRLISPYLLDDDDYVTEWLKKTTGERNGYVVANGFSTERGEMVRSKSEKMIADKLYMRGVPYKYEAALHLKGTRVVYPDFTLLKISSREELYYEHFGMMDDPDYCKQALEKIDLYESCGIMLGDKLLATFESSRKSINMKNVDAIIERCII